MKLTELRRSCLRHLVPEAIWPLDVTMGGAKIPVRGEPFSFGVKRSLVNGDYERQEVILLQEVVTPGMRIVEMGSSIGVVTRVLATLTGQDGVVIAVEADERLCRHSRQTWLGQYPNVTLLNGAGVVLESIPPGMSIASTEFSNGSLGGVVSLSDADSPTEEITHPLPLYSIGDCCSLFQAPPTLAVIDIEGGESLVTKYGADAFTCFQDIVMELHPGLYEATSAVSVTESIITTFEDSGFILRRRIGDVIWLSRRDEVRDERNQA